MKRNSALILLPVGASIAFAVNADMESVPDGSYDEPEVVVERRVQAAGGPSAGSDLVGAEIRWVDPAAGKLTVMHGQYQRLGMPPMTMVVHVKDSERLSQFRAGDRIRFAAKRVKGLLTVTLLQPEQ